METALIVALSLVNPTETLIVLTSDHSHVVTMGGQATPRGHPVLGKPHRPELRLQGNVRNTFREVRKSFVKV